MVRLRSAVGASTSPPRVQRQTRQALKEKTNTAGTKRRLHVYENDGDTEELVKSVRSRGGAEQGLSNEGDMLMTGGLGMPENQQNEMGIQESPVPVKNLAKNGKMEQEKAKLYRRPLRVTKTPASGMTQSRTREALKRRVADLSKGAESSTTKVRTSNAKLSRSPELPQHEAPSTIRTHDSASGLELSGMSLSLSSPLSDGLNSVRGGNSLLKRPGSVLRQRNTPAAEASVLVLKHFKQRPRQPSMLQLVQQHATNATLPAPHAPSPNDVSAYDLASDDEHEVEDDFQPDAEGTPLLMKQSKYKPLRSSGRSFPSGDEKLSCQRSSKRKVEAMEQSAGLYATRTDKRRRSSSEDSGNKPFDELSLALPGSPSITEDHDSPQSRTRSVVQVTNSSPLLAPLSEPPSPKDRQDHADVDVAIPSTEEHYHEFELDEQNRLGHPAAKDAYEAPNGTMAEPASSSPPPEGSLELDIGTRQPVSRNAKLMGKPGQNANAKSKAKPLSSAALQSLLPKRRQRPKPRAKQSEYDLADSDDDPALDDSDLSSDEDELSILPRRRRTKVNSAKSRPTTTTTKHVSRQSTTAAAAKRKPPAAASRRPTTTSTKPVKTYGRRSDIENESYEVAEEEREDDSSALPEISMYEATKSKELEDIKRKFAEIDALDMEFETVDHEEHRSSSSQWR